MHHNRPRCRIIDQLFGLIYLNEENVSQSAILAAIRSNQHLLCTGNGHPPSQLAALPYHLSTKKPVFEE
jgi:hypothetical protein